MPKAVKHGRGISQMGKVHGSLLIMARRSNGSGTMIPQLIDEAIYRGQQTLNTSNSQARRIALTLESSNASIEEIYALINYAIANKFQILG